MGNAYAQNKLPDPLLGFGKAVEAAFGRRIIGITPTEARFDQFNGINYRGNLYVNLAGNVGFINIAGHELYHQIEKDRPDLLVSRVVVRTLVQLSRIVGRAGQCRWV